MTLLEAINELSRQNIGDYVYSVRDRELKGWEGPKVTAWSEACMAIERCKNLDDEFSKRMEGLHYGDPEECHLDADSLLCELLTELGFSKTVEGFGKVSKWYA